MYTYHPDYIDAVACRLGPGAADALYYLHDANYNITGVIDAGVSSKPVVERYHYSPYGEVTVLNGNASYDPDGVSDATTYPEWSEDPDQKSDVGNELLFTGRRLDPTTGLQHSRYRYYHPQLGRWINRDPIGYRGGMNLYGYVGGMPTFYLDPYGLRQSGFYVWLYTGSWSVEDNVYDAATGAAGEYYTNNAGMAHQALQVLSPLGEGTSLALEVLEGEAHTGIMANAGPAPQGLLPPQLQNQLQNNPNIAPMVNQLPLGQQQNVPIPPPPPNQNAGQFFIRGVRDWGRLTLVVAGAMDRDPCEDADLDAAADERLAPPPLPLDRPHGGPAHNEVIDDVIANLDGAEDIRKHQRQVDALGNIVDNGIPDLQWIDKEGRRNILEVIDKNADNHLERRLNADPDALIWLIEVGKH